MEFSKIIAELLQHMQKIASSETVVGQPIEVANAKVIPVSQLRLGFGAGFGETEGSDAQAGGPGGAGGAITVAPQAFIVVNNEGQAHLLSLKDQKTSTVVRAIELVPDVIDKVVETGTRLMRDEGRKGASGKKAGAQEDEGSGV
jgi:uncharacterized spore protein YtfJ